MATDGTAAGEKKESRRRSRARQKNKTELAHLGKDRRMNAPSASASVTL